MPPLISNRKPSSARTKRILEDRGPKIQENEKSLLVIRGPNCPLELNPILQDINMLAKPNVAYLSRKHAELKDLMAETEVGPAVEGRAALEAMMRKADASLAVIGMRTRKKRPRSLVMARSYDGSLLDMAEFSVEIEKCQTLTKVPGSSDHVPNMEDMTWNAGAVPLVVFQGSKWQDSPDASRLQSLLLDIFGKTHHQASSASGISGHIDLKGLEHALVWSWRDDDNTICLETHKLVLLKSGSKIPRIDLKPARPRLVLRLDRCRFASVSAYRNACRIPAALMPISKTSTKNTELGVLGSMGRVHVGRMDLSQLQTRKVKGLRKKRSIDEVEPEEDSSSPQAEDGNESN